ncbi:hypothetical protein [Hymenobacter sp. AT01-02]|uniref:hypothetical protein n=1 Tax=Hymenobacter sp. AT01-02 TaxID=1571877 RepID=UPI0005F24626|nr:hypothetical protein [Hymenobacter sp. AT01-02]
MKNAGWVPTYFAASLAEPITPSARTPATVEWLEQQRKPLKEASGWLTTAAREAKAKLRLINQIEANPTVVPESRYPDFAQEAARAFRPAPVLDFIVADYQKQEQPLEALATYATRQEQQLTQAEKQITRPPLTPRRGLKH